MFKNSAASSRTGLVRFGPIAIFLATFFVYCLHAALLKDWIVDDAGISFVYARNWAQGHGLVSQPGVPPVEGYSNFLWVAIFALCFKCGIFDPLWTPKLLSVALVFGAFCWVLIGIRQKAKEAKAGPCFAGSEWPALVGLLLLSLNTPFVVWTISGLENPLFVFLLAGLYVISVQEATDERSWKRVVGAALLAAMAGMTRPDGVLYLLAFPLVLLGVSKTKRSENEKRAGPLNLARSCALYSLVFALGYGGFLAFRFATFGDLLPNTFYAKTGSTQQILLDIVRLRPTFLVQVADLLGTVGGQFGGVFVGALGALHLHLARKHALSLASKIAVLFLLLATASFLLLPPDWMLEMRFATPFILFFYVWGAALGGDLKRAELLFFSPNFSVGALGRTVIALVLLSVQLLEFAPRTLTFIKHPTLPFATVSHEFGDRFNRYARVLEAKDASLLNPDLGGTLYYSKLRVYDLAGLTDKRIARLRNQEKVPSAEFYSYVFDEMKPTFINAHDYWAETADFDATPRFRQDYFPIHEEINEAFRRVTGKVVYQGNYVRKDVCSPSQLASLRNLALGN